VGHHLPAKIFSSHVTTLIRYLHSISVLELLYAPQRSHMAPETGVYLYPSGGATCAPMAMEDIPPESQLSWLFGSHLTMSFW
jgi:hypothetical protein